MYPKAWIELFVAGFLFSNLYCGSAQRDTARESLKCDAEGEASKIWNEEVQSKLNIPVKILDGNLEASEAELVKTKLDEFTAAWEELNRAACRDFRDYNIEKEDYDKLVSCLSAAAERQGEIVSSLDLHERDAVDNIDSLERALRPCREAFR